MTTITSYKRAGAFQFAVVSLPSIVLLLVLCLLPHLSFAASTTSTNSIAIHLKSQSSQSKNLRVQRPSINKLPKPLPQPLPQSQQSQLYPADSMKDSSLRVSDTSDARFRFRFSSRKLITLNSTSGTSNANNIDHWEKFGADINGTEVGSQFGDSVAISRNGDFVAVGGRFHGSGQSANSGTVRIFRRRREIENSSRDDDKWIQIGDSIDGNEMGDYSGKSISMSDDGSIVAIGSPRHDAQGKVRLYEYSNDTWKNIAILETSESDDMPRIGCYVTLSGDGETLSFSGDKNASNMKLVRTIRKDSDSNWKSMNDIEIPGDASSTEKDCPRISLSGDGTVLVVGDNGNDNSNTLKKGRVHVYKIQELQSKVVWQPIDQTIEGENEGEMLGSSVSLSGDGRTLAAGGQDVVQIYRLAADDDMWKILSTITYATTSLGSKENQNWDGTFGSSISLSGDGTRIVIGNPENGDTGKGIVQVFQLRVDGWRQLGSPIHGRTDGERFGFSVALSRDGESWIAGGPHRHMEGAKETGYASVYGDLYVTPSESPSMTTTSPSSYPNQSPRSDNPSYSPVQNPPPSRQTKIPSINPSYHPSPQNLPTRQTNNPSPSPTYRSSYRPSQNPNTRKTDIPSSSQTSHPTYIPSYRPSQNPTTKETQIPSPSRTNLPSQTPSPAPTKKKDNIVATASAATAGGLTFSIFAVFAFMKRRRRQRNAHEYSPTISRDPDLRNDDSFKSEDSSTMDPSSFPVTLPDSSSVVDTYKCSQSKTFDTFLSHNVGTDSHGRDNHEREYSPTISRDPDLKNDDSFKSKDSSTMDPSSFPVTLPDSSSVVDTYTRSHSKTFDTFGNQYSSGGNSSDKGYDDNDDNPVNLGQHIDTDPNAEEMDTIDSGSGSICRESNSLVEGSPLKAETIDTLV